MTIDGLIILEQNGRPIVQTNFRSTSQEYARLHIDAFNAATLALASGSSAKNNNNNNNTATTNNTVDPVLHVATQRGSAACCHLESGGLTFLCPVRGDHILTDYFGELSSSSLRDNFDVVYQLLEEMLDDGYPLTTERTALRDIVTPPSLLNKILSVAGAPDFGKAPTANPFASPIPWRKLGIKHNNNEIYFDIVESLRAIVDRNGSIVVSEVWGKVEANCRLSGLPDLSMTFVEPKVLDDCSFHPCVRLQKWSRDKTVSFVPPDGHFNLMEYRYTPTTSSTVLNTTRQIPIPFTLSPSINISENGGSFDITITSRLSSRIMERISLRLHLGDGATGANCTVTSGSSWGFDPKTRNLTWDVLKAPQGSSHTLRGTFSTTQARPQLPKAFSITFELAQYTFSGLKVNQLRLSHETYKPYKGVKGKAGGEVEWRW